LGQVKETYVTNVLTEHSIEQFIKDILLPMKQKDLEKVVGNEDDDEGAPTDEDSEDEGEEEGGDEGGQEGEGNVKYIIYIDVYIYTYI
jgi:hypothetical protein